MFQLIALYYFQYISLQIDLLFNKYEEFNNIRNASSQESLVKETLIFVLV